MDGNNQIVPIDFGICKGETGPCWSWWMSVLKECIGDNHNLLFISDRHAAITWAVQNEFPLAYHAPDAYDKLCEVGPQRWSRAHCPLVRYNYLTSNSVESVNACTVVYRKLHVLKLAETYRAMVQDWYYKRSKLAENMTYEITDWAANKVRKKMMKSAKWVVCGVSDHQYQVYDGRYNRQVDFHTGTCQCRKWQLSGLPCGHVIAVTKYLGLTDCLQFVSDWFKKPKYQGTYAEPIHFIGNVQEWEFSQHIRKAIPPRMDNPQPGRPKNTKRIKSQDMITYLTRKISRRFTTLYYTLPPNNTLSGLKQIKNDYDTNVMYDIARVAGKIQLFVSHHQIDLSTVLIPNDGSLEEAFAAHYKLQIYIDHLGVDFIIAKYIFPNASLAEMMKHVITNYTSDSEDNKREVTQNDYTFNQMVEWEEQEHFEDEETKLSCPKIDLST
ncbi:transposase, MuDR, MULE transposase domain protein, partial [Tanacetum coccineum]